MPSKAGVKAGKAFVIIGAVDKTAMVMKRISAKMKAFAMRMQSLGQSMLTKSLALLIPTGIAVSRFAQFDDSMKKVEARSKGTAAELKALRDQAKELGRQTSFTAVQVGELQAKLSQKGFGRGQIKEMTDDVLALARAAGEGGEGDAVMSADLISGTLKAFQMEAAEAGRIADVYTTAVNNSNFSLEGMLDGMAKVGPLANDMNLSLEETVATLASMTNLNISATESGTALQSFLARMSKGEFTGKFNKGLEKLTGATVQFRDAEGNLRKPLDLMQDIGEATKDLGTAARADLLSILFGVRQFGKASASIGGVTDAMGLLHKLQKEARGEAKKTAATMDSGLGGTFRILRSAVEGLGISIGEALEEPLQRLGPQITTFLNGLTEWIEKNKGLIVLLVSTAAAVALTGVGLIVLAGTIKIVAGVIGILSVAVGVLKVAIIALISPIGLFILALAGIGTALYTLSSSIRDVLNDMGSFFAEKFAAIGKTVSDTFGGMLDAIAMGDLQAAWEIFGQGITTTWLQVVDTLGEAWEGFATFFIEAWQGAKMAVLQTWYSLQKGIATGIMRLAEDAGVLGEALDLIVGTDVSETKAKAGALEAQRQQILRNRLKTFEDEAAALKAQRKAGGGSPELDTQISGLDAQIADLKSTLGSLNDSYEDTVDGMKGGFDQKIEQAGVDAGKALASWNDRVQQSNKARDDSIKAEKENLRRMLEEIRTRKDTKEQEDEFAAMDAERMKAEEEFGKSMIQGAAGKGPIAAGIPGVSITPQKALEQGSVGAAQKIAEMQFKEGVQAKQLAEAKKTNELLEDANVQLKKIESPVGV